MNEQRAQLSGSATQLPQGARWLSPANDDERLEISIILRRPETAASAQDREADLLSGRYQAPSRAEVEQALAARPEDLQAVRTFATNYGLQVESENANTRTAKLSGTVAQLNQAFGIKLSWVQPTAGSKFLSYQGAISLPATLQNVEAVLGLDQRPIARHASAVIARDSQ